MLKSLDGSTVEDFCYRVIKSTQKDFRMSCFTTKMHNPLMWGHYADGMRGVCLEYEIDEGDVYKVEYGKSYEVDMSNILQGNAEEEVISTFLKKSSDWKYEDEYRVISRNIFYSLGKRQLKKMYFGYKCDPNKAKFLKEIAEKSFGSHVKFYVARNSMFDHTITSDEVVDSCVKPYIESARNSVDDYQTFITDKKFGEMMDMLEDLD